MPYKVVTNTGRAVDLDSTGGRMFVEGGALYSVDEDENIDAIFAVGFWERALWVEDEGDDE